jgi:predicted MarR family transcription regulator
MTDNAKKVLYAIRSADSAGKPMPSVRELMLLCDIKSTSIVGYALQALAREGLIVLGDKGHARSYRLAESADRLLLRRCLAFVEAFDPNAALRDELEARLK